MWKNKRKIKAAVGDVFILPVSGDEYGLGQMVAELPGGSMYYVVGFPGLFTDATRPPLEQVVRRPPVILSQINDSALEDGRWPIVGTAEVERGHPLPANQVGDNGVQVVRDWSGERSRPATEGELEILGYNSSLTTGAFLEAFLGFLGRGERLPYYDKFVPNPDRASSLFFPPGSADPRALAHMHTAACDDSPQPAGGMFHVGDRTLLEQLRQRSDLGQARHWVHYLYLPDIASARAVAAAAAAEGWVVGDVEEEDDEETVAVIAELPEALVTPETVSTARAFFEALVAPYAGGEYDGWEAAV